jgi:hypothetical protein
MERLSELVRKHIMFKRLGQGIEKSIVELLPTRFHHLVMVQNVWNQFQAPAGSYSKIRDSEHPGLEVGRVLH